MIYFDQAATGLQKPPCVARAVAAALGTLGNPSRGGYPAALAAERTVYRCREQLAALFHAENPQQIAFTSNATQALNTAITAMYVPGGHIITTAMEHNSVLRPCYRLRARGMALTVLPCDALGRISLEQMERAIRPETVAVICTHASNLTGNLNDITAIGALCARYHILFIVDAAQTAGVFPIDLQADQISVLCFTGHKGLLGPQGTGGLCVRTDVTLEPLLVGGSGVQSFSEGHPTEMPTALEAGTLNAHGIAGLSAALDYLERTGLGAIREREHRLARRFTAGLSSLSGLTLYGDFSGAERAPIVSLNLSGWSSAELADALSQDYGICVRSGAHCAPLMHRALGTEQCGAVRFSFSHFNTEEEVDQAIHALWTLGAEA